VLIRNLTKPFSIGGFILGEIYMVLLCLAPYRTAPPPRLPMGVELPIPPSTLPPGTPIPTDVLALKMAVSAIFFGPFGALVGAGVGLLIGALLDRLRPRPEPAPPARTAPQSSASSPADSASEKN
jgi:hypothetical protein